MCRTDQIALCSSAGEISYVSAKAPLGMMTVLELKMCAVQTFPKSGLSLTEMQLIHKNKPMDMDAAFLSKYGVKADTVVQIVTKVHGG